MLEMDRPMCYDELRVRLLVINFTKLCADRVYLDFRLASVEAFTTIEAWQRIKHPNIISVKEAFTTRAFGDSCEYLDIDSACHNCDC